MNYHRSIHAERFFRISMGMQAVTDEAIAAPRDASLRFLERARAAMRELRESDWDMEASGSH